MADNFHGEIPSRINGSIQVHNPREFDSASLGARGWKDERSQWTWVDNNILPNALDLVDNTLAPPTEVNGDIYIIDDTGASHVDWDGAAANSWVRYNSTDDAWNEITAAEGLICYIEDAGFDEFRFFNGTDWIALAGGGGSDGDGIYDGSGSLSANTVVTQGGNTLDFTTSIVDGFSVDGTTFSVDGANNRIGIGTASPAASAIVDITSTTGALLVSRMTTTQRDLLTASNGMIVYNTTTGLFNVREGGQWNTVGGIYSGAGSLSGNTTVSQGGNQLNFEGTAVNGFNVDGTTFSVDMSNGRVGIGTTAPTQKLDVVGGALISSFLNVASGAFKANTVSGKSGFNMGAVVPQVELQVLHSNSNTSLDVGALTFADLPFTIRNTDATAGNKTLINFQNSAAGGVVFIGAQHNNHTGDSDFIIMTNDGANAEKLRVGKLGGVTLSNLSGAGDRMVTADANGLLSTQAIPAGGGGNTIYSADDSLAGNRIVTQGANTLSFTGTAVNGFSVGGTTLSVDMFNGRIGIGTTAPTQKLQVIGGALISSFLDVGSGAFTTNTVSGKSGFNMGGVVPQVELQVLHSNANTSLDAGALTLADLPFTIRNTNATAGNKTLINFQNSAGGGTLFVGAQHNDHAGDTDFIIMTNDGANAEKFRVQKNGNIGMGVTSPTTTLDVSGEVHSTVSSGTANDLGTGDGTTTIDLSLGDYHHLLFGAFNETFTITNPPATGSSFGFVLELTKDATATTRTITMPASVKTDQGLGINDLTTTSQVMILSFVTRDAGTTWYASEVITDAS